MYAVSNAYHISVVKGSNFEQNLKINQKFDNGECTTPISCNAMGDINALLLAMSQSSLD